MSQQLNLPGLEETGALFTPESIADPRHQLRKFTLFAAVFPAPDDAQRLAQRAAELRAHHGLQGKLTDPGRLHITLHEIAHFFPSLPLAHIDAAKAAAASVNCAAVPVVMQRALTFLGSNAFVLRCDAASDAALAELREALGQALTKTALRPKAAATPHMTMLYDDRRVAEHAIEPLRWTATRFALVVSHVGLHHHEWLGEWPLTRRQRQSD